MTDADHRPPRPAIEDQLKRMLASPRFLRHEKPPEVFSLLVKTALDRKSLSGKEILNQVFRHGYKPDAPHVTAAVHTIRQLLKEYYDNEGAQDPVKIELPLPLHRGRTKKTEKAYTATFSYSNHFSVFYDLEKARAYWRLLTPTAIESARGEIGGIYSKTQEYLPADILRIECYISIAVLFPSFFEIGPNVVVTETPESKTVFFRRKTLPQPAQYCALELTRHLAKRYPDDERVHLILAAALLLTYEPQQAREAILAAEALNSRVLEDSLVAVAYDLVTNNPESAIDKSMAMCNRSVSNLLHVVVMAFCGNLCPNADVRLFGSVLGFDPHNWLAYLGLVFEQLRGLDATSLETIDYSGITAKYRRMHELSAEDDPIMPGLGCLAYYKEFGTLDDSSLAKKIAASLRSISDHPPETRDWIQVAIALLGTDLDESVRALYAAVEHRHPLALLLPFWPVFDPLRDREDFKQLLRHLDAVLGR